MSSKKKFFPNSLSREELSHSRAEVVKSPDGRPIVVTVVEDGGEEEQTVRKESPLPAWEDKTAQAEHTKQSAVMRSLRKGPQPVWEDDTAQAEQAVDFAEPTEKLVVPVEQGKGKLDHEIELHVPSTSRHVPLTLSRVEVYLLKKILSPALDSDPDLRREFFTRAVKYQVPEERVEILASLLGLI